MTLEEKIAELSPELRVQLEDYVDFLLHRSSGKSEVEGYFPNEDAEGEEPVLINPAPPAGSPSPLSTRGKVSSSGIILAEERLPSEGQSDYVEFADINSRFGHTPKNEEDQRGPGRIRRFLDWM